MSSALNESHQSSLEQLAVANYRLAIDLPEALSFTGLRLRESLESYRALTPALQRVSETATALSDKGSAIVHDLRRHNSAIQRHTQILEILELPQLIETCVKHSFFDEAVELLGKASALARAHRDIAVLQRLGDDAERARTTMASQLLTSLSGELTLPQCLSAITYLRRIAVFSELVR
jgi:hypothetical protein